MLLSFQLILYKPTKTGTFLVYTLHIYFGEISNEVSPKNIISGHIFTVNYSILLHWLSFFYYFSFLFTIRYIKKFIFTMKMRLDFNPVTTVIYANTIKGKSES